ncbi:MAG TPA: nickel-dependent lactate racemase [Anaerolineales bacterium]
MQQKIQLPYGGGTVEFTLPVPNLAGIFLPRPVPACQDPDEEVRHALRSPLDLPPLSEIVKPREKVVVLVDDHTRATPAGQILPHILEELHQAGAQVDDITILVTHGTHRLSSAEEVRRKVGEAVFRRYRIEQHQCMDEEDQAYLGVTSRGTPVWVNRRVVETDRLIGIGHVGPSPYAGYSGGNKLIVPGVASLDTINANHSMVVLGFRQFGRVDLPCRLDIQEAAGMVKLDMVLDVVLSQDERIVKAFTGTPEAVFRAGVELAKQVSEVACPGELDFAVTSGFPYDLDLYQAVRAVEYADAVVREGGSILLVAACPDGIGGQDFFQLLAGRNQQPDDFLRQVVRRQGMVTFSVLGYALSRIKAEKKIYLLTEGISTLELKAMGICPVEHLQDCVDQILNEYGPRPKAAVFPQGSSTIPIVN